MICLVTGAAGFIGSTVSRILLDRGWEVRGVDCFTDFYPRAMKERNISDLIGRRGFELVEEDLVNCPVDPLLEGVKGVIHLAA